MAGLIRGSQRCTWSLACRTSAPRHFDNQVRHCMDGRLGRRSELAPQAGQDRDTAIVSKRRQRHSYCQQPKTETQLLSAIDDRVGGGRHKEGREGGIDNIERIKRERERDEERGTWIVPIWHSPRTGIQGALRVSLWYVLPSSHGEQIRSLPLCTRKVSGQIGIEWSTSRRGGTTARTRDTTAYTRDTTAKTHDTTACTQERTRLLSDHEFRPCQQRKRS